MLFSSSSSSSSSSAVAFSTHIRLKNVVRLRRISPSCLVSSNSLIPCHVHFDIPSGFLPFWLSYLLAVCDLSPLRVFFLISYFYLNSVLFLTFLNNLKPVTVLKIEFLLFCTFSRLLFYHLCFETL